MHTLIASLRAADNYLIITYLVHVFFFPQNLSGCSCQVLKLLLFKPSWSRGLLSQGKQACLCSCIRDILQCSNLLFTDICNIDPQIKTHHPWVRFFRNHIVNILKPLLTATSLQWPLLFILPDKKSMHWLLLKPLYNGHLFDFTMAAFFCPQGGHRWPLGWFSNRTGTSVDDRKAY